MHTLIESFGCRFELLQNGDDFVGLGRVWIGETLVRSGRLPLHPTTQTFPEGHTMALAVLSVQKSEAEIRIALRARFLQAPAKLMRDHSLDPIHPLDDWDAAPDLGRGELDLVIRPAQDSFNGVEFNGFAYQYEYRGEAVALFHLLDKASWELDGDIVGATAYSQSACSAPVAKFDSDTGWSTEGMLFFLVEKGNQNPVMTHNLPRWASHGAFDFQFKGNKTLVGVFERVELIRSILLRDAGKPELKCFDKHIFDQAAHFATAPKQILLNTEAKTDTAQKNLWTWIHCEVERRARAEIGLREEPFLPTLSQNYWENYTTESYSQDLIPAARDIGCRAIFVDNLHKSAYTEDAPNPGRFHWNMCCGHEYEISEKLGGLEGLASLVARCAEENIRVFSWTNNDQALSSPINSTERDDAGRFVLMDDARQKHGGAYTNVMSFLDFSVEAARDYFVESHLKVQAATGHNALFLDSFYNALFMPVSFREMKPRTLWRGTLEVLKRMQDAGFSFRIESFGPFGMPAHGHPSSYNFDSLFICYRVGLGSNYATVPTDQPLFQGHPDGPKATYITLAHMAGCDLSLFKNEVRIDRRWTAEHRTALRDYHAVLPDLHTRYLQEDGLSVVWKSVDEAVTTIFNFAARSVQLDGDVFNVTEGIELPYDAEFLLKPFCTYQVSVSRHGFEPRLRT